MLYKYIISSLGAGLMNGFLGAGGGIILVPLLISWVGLQTKQAFATSVFIILPISIVSAIFYFTNGNIDLRQALPYLAGGFLGGILCGKYFKKLPVNWLRRAFGLLLIVGGVRAFFR